MKTRSPTVLHISRKFAMFWPNPLRKRWYSLWKHQNKFKPFQRQRFGPKGTISSRDRKHRMETTRTYNFANHGEMQVSSKPYETWGNLCTLSKTGPRKDCKLAQKVKTNRNLIFPGLQDGLFVAWPLSTWILAPAALSPASEWAFTCFRTVNPFRTVNSFSHRPRESVSFPPQSRLPIPF